ncbi:protein NETWORKED 1A-like [Castanea sativa]|uniref:protein NETWORKED 1A-like n=1 Tax=Castanea sativa TaxID=21020 RepID=UPI003F64E674
MEIHPYENSCQELKEGQRTAIPDGISQLQKMQTRIKAVEKTVMEEMERLATQESINTNIKVEDVMKETEDFKPKGKLPQERGLESQRTKPENGILMKDVPLDQVSDTSFYGRSKIDNGRADDEMLELWETAEQECGQGPMVNETQKQASAPVEDVNACYRLEDGEKSQDLPSELEIEKELGIDKLEVSTSVRQPNQDVNKGKFLDAHPHHPTKVQTL